jgi:hypothetical protein
MVPGREGDVSWGDPKNGKSTSWRGETDVFSIRGYELGEDVGRRREQAGGYRGLDDGRGGCHDWR